MREATAFIIEIRRGWIYGKKLFEELPLIEKKTFNDPSELMGMYEQLTNPHVQFLANGEDQWSIGIYKAITKKHKLNKEKLRAIIAKRMIGSGI